MLRGKQERGFVVSLIVRLGQASAMYLKKHKDASFLRVWKRAPIAFSILFIGPVLLVIGLVNPEILPTWVILGVGCAVYLSFVRLIIREYRYGQVYGHVDGFVRGYIEATGPDAWLHDSDINKALNKAAIDVTREFASFGELRVSSDPTDHPASKEWANAISTQDWQRLYDLVAKRY